MSSAIKYLYEVNLDPLHSLMNERTGILSSVVSLMSLVCETIIFSALTISINIHSRGKMIMKPAAWFFLNLYNNLFSLHFIEFFK